MLNIISPSRNCLAFKAAFLNLVIDVVEDSSHGFSLNHQVLIGSPSQFYFFYKLKRRCFGKKIKNGLRSGF
jgi:hypothetical protein